MTETACTLKKRAYHFFLIWFYYLQHYLSFLGGTVAAAIILAPHMCIGDDTTAQAEILSNMIFLSGIITLLQTTFGVR